MERYFELETTWQDALGEELNKPYFKALRTFVDQERGQYTIYPPEPLVFNAFNRTRFDQVKVVIVGQDPYHNPGQAEGLCFSVARGVTPPPSLKNIFKELQDDVKIPLPSHGSLISWTRQGVLLLNATLTVRENQPLSHHGKGWEQFTDAVIRKLVEGSRPLVFILWGKSAKDKCKDILATKKPHHLILSAAHPSPYSASGGFFGCRHFSLANRFLEEHHLSPIDWSLN